MGTGEIQCYFIKYNISQTLISVLLNISLEVKLSDRPKAVVSWLVRISQVMDTPWRPFGTKEAKEWHEAIVEWDSSFASFPSACVI